MENATTTTMASPKLPTYAPANGHPDRQETLPDPIRDEGGAGDNAPSNMFIRLFRIVSTRLKDQAKPEVAIGAPPTLLQQFKSVIFMSWLNVLLVFIPLSVRTPSISRIATALN